MSSDDGLVELVFPVGALDESIEVSVTSASSVPGNVDEADLRLCKVINGGWEIIAGSTVAVEGNTVNGAVMSFSSYGPGQPSAGQEGQITVAPAEITLPVYGAWTFDLTVEGLENEAVTWSITEGVIVDTITTLENGLDLHQFNLLGIDQEGEIFLYFPHDEVIVSRLSPAHEYLGSALRDGDDICESVRAETVDSYGNVYATDNINGMILKFRQVDN